jgi:hypothetical protein
MGVPAAIGISASGLPSQTDKASAVLSGKLTAIGPTAPFAFRGPMNLLIYASINTSLTTTKDSLNAVVGSAAGLAIGDAVNSIYAPPGSTIGNLSGTTATLALPPVTLPAYDLSVSSANIKLPPGCNAASLVGATVTVDPGYPSSQCALPAGTTVLAVVQQDTPPSAGFGGYPAIVTLSAEPTAVPINSRNSTGRVPFVFAPTANAIGVAGTDNNAIFTGAAIEWSGTVQLERTFDGGNTWVVCNIGGAGTLAQFTAGTPVSIVFGEPEKNVLYRLNCTAYTSGTINYRLSETAGANEALNYGPLVSG